MIIDIKKYENNTLYSYSDVSRKILTDILKERNILCQQKEFYNNIVIGIDIFLRLQDLSGFHVNQDLNEKCLVEVGKIMGMTVHREVSGNVKDNEVLFFNKYEDLPYTKVYQRKYKLKRILEE